MRFHFVATTTLCLATAFVACTDHAVTPTVAQVERVRAGLSVEETAGRATPVEGVLRVTAGAVISTDQNGRGIVALDHGERVLLDQGTRIKVTSTGGAELLEGRIWTSSGDVNDPAAGDAAMVRAGSALLRLRGVRASIERQGDGVALDVLEGEVAWESGSRQGAVRAGNHAVIRSGGADLTARTLFDDWTGGLADEATAGASVGGAMGLGAVAARRPDEQGAPRWALVLQRLDARVAIVGDLAITELEQTFFNPAADTVEGLYTLTVPRGAVLQRFAVDRRGALVDGFVRERNVAAREYRAQVYAGSTHDPALLEWDAPGRYHARLFPITPAMTRRVLVSYTQWLTPRQDGGRSWRLPLASLGARIGELHVDVDVSRAGAREVRASEGARRDDTHVFFQRSDAVPTADFVLDLRATAPREGTSVRASAEGAALGRDRSGFVRVSVQAPEVDARAARDEGVDLVVLVDHSAATEGASLGLGQAFAEALVRSLTARDRLLVMAGDVGARALGNAGGRLEAVTAAKRQELLDALALDRRGGATDLGAMIQAAHAALDPQRNGSIVYIGDGQATVGEDTAAALRARVARMSPRPRFYAVAMGEAPRLDLLTSVAEPSGFAVRVTRRGEVARAAIDLISHAVRPLVREVRADLGPGVERVYPSEPVDVPAGEPLVLIGRYTRDPPTTATVRATWHGRAISRTVSLVATAVVDHNDLRYRWASARLEHLLARGESRAVIVELGTRFGLVTPHTSLYVPSEDEPLPRQRTTRTSDTRDFSVFDLVPFVGCARYEAAPQAPVSAQSVESTSVALPNPNVSPIVAAPTPAGGEGQMGRRAARNSRYAIRHDGDPSAATTQTAAAQSTERREEEPATQAVAANGIPTPEAVNMPVAPPQPPMLPIAAPNGRRTGATSDLRGVSAREIGRAGLAARSLDEETLARDGAEESERSRRSSSLRGWDDDTLVNRDQDRASTPPAAQAAARVLSRCSDAATVVLSERVALWRERLSRDGSPAGALRVWSDARQACELPSWPDRVALLRAIVATVTSVDDQLRLYQLLAREPGARAWVRDALLRTLARRGELGRASALGLNRLDAATLSAALARATTPVERLNVLRLLARRAPDDLELTLLLLDAAGAANDSTEVRRVAAKLRDDPRTDARVRTAVGEALLAIGDEAEARRTFSEIVEFAPDDPWARRRLGDIALAHGWADEAYRQYQTLAAQMNDAPEILLRLAWAARAAGRLDEALRLAERVTTQTAPGAAGVVAEAAAAWIAAELAIASADPATPRATLTALRARWRRSPAARSAGAVRVLLRWAHPDDDAELYVASRGDTTRRADLVSSAVALESSVWAEAPADDGALSIEVRRAGGARPRGACELVVIWNEGTERERVARRTVNFDPTHLRAVLAVADGSIREVSTDARIEAATQPGGAR